MVQADIFQTPYLDFNQWRLNFTLGTPPLPFEGYLDTLSNGFWVIGQDGHCWDGAYCDQGKYDLRNSSTGKRLDEGFTYSDYGSSIEGLAVADVLTIGDIKVDNMTFGVLDTRIENGSSLSKSARAISTIMTVIDSRVALLDNIGIGYGDASTTTLPQVLVDTGAINSPAVSLWNGTILFGGVNKAKYEGDLYSFDTVMGNSSIKSLRINMDGISINGSSEASDEFPLDAVFSLGTTNTFVPKSVAQALNAQIGVTNVPDESGQVNFSCKTVPQDTTITFKFGKLDFDFDLEMFISRGSFEPVEPWADVGDTDLCYFEILENKFTDSYDGSIFLGSNFISRVYSVFDLENDQISLAKRNTDDAPDDIVEITSGKDGVPGAKGSPGTRVGGDLSMTALVAATAMLIMTF